MSWVPHAACNCLQLLHTAGPPQHSHLLVSIRMPLKCKGVSCEWRGEGKTGQRPTSSIPVSCAAVQARVPLSGTWCVPEAHVAVVLTRAISAELILSSAFELRCEPLGLVEADVAQSCTLRMRGLLSMEAVSIALSGFVAPNHCLGPLTVAATLWDSTRAGLQEPFVYRLRRAAPPLVLAFALHPAVDIDPWFGPLLLFLFVMRAPTGQLYTAASNIARTLVASWLGLMPCMMVGALCIACSLCFRAWHFGSGPGWCRGARGGHAVMVSLAINSSSFLFVISTDVRKVAASTPRPRSWHVPAVMQYQRLLSVLLLPALGRRPFVLTNAEGATGAGTTVDFFELFSQHMGVLCMHTRVVFGNLCICLCASPARWGTHQALVTQLFAA